MTLPTTLCPVDGKPCPCPPDEQRDCERASGRKASNGLLCPSCGSMMYPASLLKGYDDLADQRRPTCALHGPRGSLRHLGGDR